MRTKSKEIYEKACSVIPGGVNSPVRSFRHLDMLPLVVESGKGSLIRDVDGNSYIDFCLSWGALIVGHAHPKVVKGVGEQMEKGSSFGINTEIEWKLASEIASEKIRFVSSGTEATMTALRLARGFTGRSKIVKFTGHYHGHSDSLLVQAGSGASHLPASLGVPPSVIADTICLPFNDFEAVRSLFQKEEVAALILEPIAGNMGVVLPEKGFLEFLREETSRTKSLLIFDEVITGFRVGFEGAQGLYGIKPDLTCFGKIIGGGFPVAAIHGKKEILDCLAPLGNVYQAGTLSGNPVAMRAGLETVSLLKEKHFYQELQKKTDRMTQRIEEALENKNGCLQKQGSMFNIFFGHKKVVRKEKLNEELFKEFFQYLFARGIYISPSPYEAWFLSSAHTDDQIDYATETIVQYLGGLA